MLYLLLQFSGGSVKLAAEYLPQLNGKIGSRYTIDTVSQGNKQIIAYVMLLKLQKKCCI